MTSIRESIRRLFRGDRDPQQPDPEFAYRIHWVSQSQQWSCERRIAIRKEVEARIMRADFEPRLTERCYLVEELDDAKHSGVSLMVLLEILKALEA